VTKPCLVGGLLSAILCFTLFPGLTSVLHAQASDRDWEVGIHFPVANLQGFQVTEPGVGLSANRWLVDWKFARLSLDGQADYFPGIHSFQPEQKRFPYWHSAEEVSKMQAMLGLRVGARVRRTAEVFGTVRPGLFRFSNMTLLEGGCLAVYPSPESCFANHGKTRPLVNVGAGLLLGPDRWFFRLDLGDNLVHYDLQLIDVPYIGPPVEGLWSLNRRPGYDNWKHHFQASAGVGFRF